MDGNISYIISILDNNFAELFNMSKQSKNGY